MKSAVREAASNKSHADILIDSAEHAHGTVVMTVAMPNLTATHDDQHVDDFALPWLDLRGYQAGRRQDDQVTREESRDRA